MAQLMAQEGEIVRQIQGLDSDMQTLVYENYNKFISATDTIRKMKNRVEARARLPAHLPNPSSFAPSLPLQARPRPAFRVPLGRRWRRRWSSWRPTWGPSQRQATR